MHCWKVIHIEREYGPVRLLLLNVLAFVLVFSFSYVIMSFNYATPHEDHFFWINLLIFPLIYPLHKYIHYLALFGYKKSLANRLVFKYKYVPVIQMRLKDLIPKWRYIFALVAPFLLINSSIIVASIEWPQFAHYLSFYLAFHCSICVLDFLYVKNLITAPNNAIIEETPKGYEILIPPTL